MKLFFILEGAYIILSIFILLVTAFITTRNFMPKNSFKKGMTIVFINLLIFIIAHFFVTSKRINNVIKAFSENKTIICENRIYTKGANYIEIKKSSDWKIEELNFKSPHYNRDFFIARCFVK